MYDAAVIGKFIDGRKVTPYALPVAEQAKERKG
jgi:hypothetical protein